MPIALVEFSRIEQNEKGHALTNGQSGFADALQKQKDAIARYISQGVEHSCGECIGMELEHFVVTKNKHDYVPFLDDPVTGLPGVQSVLERLRPFYSHAVHETQADGSKVLLGLSREYASISLEPGAQLEVSLGPVLDIPDLEDLYRDFRKEIDPILDELGLEMLELGYHPSICARDIPLLPKSRYRFMNEHFKHTGKHGICMMRATAATQVSIDFNSEEDAIEKFKVAHALSPLLAFITDNSPVFELEPIGSNTLCTTGLSIPKRMVRTAVWNDVDATRSNTPPGTFEEGFCFDSYALNILLAPAIFSVEYDSQTGKRSIDQAGRSVMEVYADKQLDRITIELILSLYFYDVRFKTYLEIRAADALPIDYALSYVALLKGIFYNKKTLADLVIRFSGLTAQDIVTAKQNLTEHAFTADVYGKSAQNWLDELLICAENSLLDHERAYLKPLGELIRNSKCLTMLQK